MSQPAISRQQALDQRRGQHAWQVVQEVRRRYGQNGPATQFGRAAKKLPIRIVASGLGQALAFLLAKKKTPLLLAVLSDWVLAKRNDERAAFGLPDVSNDRDPRAQEAQKALIQKLITSDMTFLRMATDEVLAYLLWLNRFAEAEGLAAGEDVE